jgi:hypothetical protein
MALSTYWLWPGSVLSPDLFAADQSSHRQHPQGPERHPPCYPLLRYAVCLRSCSCAGPTAVLPVTMLTGQVQICLFGCESAHMHTVDVRCDESYPEHTPCATQEARTTEIWSMTLRNCHVHLSCWVLRLGTRGLGCKTDPEVSQLTVTVWLQSVMSAVQALVHVFPCLYD